MMGNSPLGSRCVAGILLLAAFFCWRLGWNTAVHTKGLRDIALLCDAGSYIAADRDRLRREGEELALWSQQEKQRLTASGSGREATVCALLVEGDTRLLFPQAATLAPDDAEGCLIDRKTAISLTGTEHAAGLTLEWNGRSYTVRGTLAAPAGTAVFRPASGDVLAHIALRGDSDLFVLRNGAPQLLINGSIYAEAAGFFLWMPVFLAGWFMQRRLLARCRRSWRWPVRHAVYGAGRLLFLTALLLLLLFLLPGWMSPARWSDFAFWSVLREEIRTYAGAYLTAARLRPDVLRIGWVLTIAAWEILAAALLIAERYLAGATPYMSQVSYRKST